MVAASTLSCSDSWAIGADILMGRRKRGRRRGRLDLEILSRERSLKIKTRALASPEGILQCDNSVLLRESESKIISAQHEATSCCCDTRAL